MPEQNEVNIAFELLLEEIETVIDALNKEAEETFKARDYEKIRTLIEAATKITDFREKVKNLQKEWQSLFASKTFKIRRKTQGKFKKIKTWFKNSRRCFQITYS